MLKLLWIFTFILIIGVKSTTLNDVIAQEGCNTSVIIELSK